MLGQSAQFSSRSGGPIFASRNPESRRHLRQCDRANTFRPDKGQRPADDNSNNNQNHFFDCKASAQPRLERPVGTAALRKDPFILPQAVY